MKNSTFQPSRVLVVGHKDWLLHRLKLRLERDGHEVIFAMPPDLKSQPTTFDVIFWDEQSVRSRRAVIALVAAVQCRSRRPRLILLTVKDAPGPGSEDLPFEGWLSKYASLSEIKIWCLAISAALAMAGTFLNWWTVIEVLRWLKIVKGL